MALSEDTQAIIDRLKAEGDLIRNSGTNSMRAVNIKLDRFEGLFKSINENVVSQTDMMRQQMGIAAKQRRQEETRRQQEEVLPPEPTTEPAGSPVNGRENGERNIDNVSKSIAEALSFKNIVLGGAALFAGYNILKGFIDQKTGGGFTDMESGIGDFASKLKDFEMPDFTATMEKLNSSIDGLKATIDQLKTDIDNAAAKLKDWQWWIGLAIGAIGPFVAINRLLKIRLERLRQQTIEMERAPNVTSDSPNQPRLGAYDVDPANPNFKGWGEDGKPVFRDAPNAPKVVLLPDGTPVRGTSPVRVPTPSTETPRLGTPTDLDRPPVAPGAFADGAPRMTTPDMSTPELRAQNRPIIADSITRSGGRIGYNQQAGRFTVNPDGTGGFLSDAEAIKMMEQNIAQEAPRYSKAFANVVKFLKFLGPPALAYEIFRVYVELTSDSTKEQKIAAVSGIIGGMGIGFVAGALTGAQLGVWFGPWAALIGGLLAGVAFGFGGEYLIRAMVEAFFEEPEAKQARYKEMQEHQAEAMRQNGSYADYLGAMERLQMGGATAYSDSGFIPNLGFGQGRLLGNSKGNYFMGIDGQLYRQDGQTYRVERMSFGGAGQGNVVINAPQISAPVVNNVEGGKSANYIQMASFGGGGGGFGSDDPYNLSFIS